MEMCQLYFRSRYNSKRANLLFDLLFMPEALNSVSHKELLDAACTFY